MARFRKKGLEKVGIEKRVEKRCTGNEWVNEISANISVLVFASFF